LLITARRSGIILGWRGQVSDSCWASDPNSGVDHLASFDQVTSPFGDGYYWLIGQIGNQSGYNLNGASPSYASNYWGWDYVGYTVGYISIYNSDLAPLGELPCGTFFLQEMWILCPNNWMWDSFMDNNLTAEIGSDYVENCHEDNESSENACAYIYY